MKTLFSMVAINSKDGAFSLEASLEAVGEVLGSNVDEIFVFPTFARVYETSKEPTFEVEYQSCTQYPRVRLIDGFFYEIIERECILDKDTGNPIEKNPISYWDNSNDMFHYYMEIRRSKLNPENPNDLLKILRVLYTKE